MILILILCFLHKLKIKRLEPIKNNLYNNFLALFQNRFIFSSGKILEHLHNTSSVRLLSENKCSLSSL